MRYLLFFLALPVFAGDLDKALTATCKALPPATAARLTDWAKANKRGDSCESILRAIIQDTNAAIGTEKEAKTAQQAIEAAQSAKATLDAKAEALKKEVQ